MGDLAFEVSTGQAAQRMSPGGTGRIEELFTIMFLGKPFHSFIVHGKLYLVVTDGIMYWRSR